MRLRNVLAAATCAACLVLPFTVPTAAHAQPVTGPYVSLGAGTSIQAPVNGGTGSFDESYSFGNEFSSSEIGTYDTALKALFKPGLAGQVSAGWGFGNGFRVELSADYSHNSIAKTDSSGEYGYQEAYTVDGTPESTFGYFNKGTPYSNTASGGEKKYGIMANVLYDLDVGLPVYPYLGAGVGYQFLSDRYNEHDSFEDENETFRGSGGSFAYNIIAGLSYPISVVPGLSVTAEYRFMQLVQDHNIHGSYSFADGYNFNYRATQKIGQESSHTFLLGLRYSLFPPAAAVAAMAPAAAPPAAAPAPAPARTFIVFFDWDKYNLTPRATEIISEAASDSKTSGVTTLDVSGYTDTSGTADYNMGLSQRRAEAVAAKLEADGVAASEIEIHAYGETHLLVATGPGVREPQNRRVEIVLN